MAFNQRGEVGLDSTGVLAVVDGFGKAIFRRPGEGDRDVQQHVADAVLVHDVTVGVQHCDDVCFETPQIGECELALDAVDLKKP